MTDDDKARFAATRRRVLALSAGAAASAMLTGLWPALAQTRLDVTQGNVAPLPIAIPEFLGGAPGDTEVARGITQVITGNLRRSGLFAPIDPAAFIEKIASFDALQRLVEQSSDENGKQLSNAQLEAIRREMTFIKERLYP